MPTPLGPHTTNGRTYDGLDGVVLCALDDVLVLLVLLILVGECEVALSLDDDALSPLRCRNARYNVATLRSTVSPEAMLAVACGWLQAKCM